MRTEKGYPELRLQISETIDNGLEKYAYDPDRVMPKDMCDNITEAVLQVVRAYMVDVSPRMYASTQFINTDEVIYRAMLFNSALFPQAEG